MPPDLDAFGADAGLPPFVRVFDTGRPGPHLVVNALMHGNEYAGAHALIRLIRHGPQPTCGRLTLTLGNVTAFHRFDIATPLASRFIDIDMNRIWSPNLWDARADTLEHQRARDLWPIFARADQLLDLHSMYLNSPPLMLSGPTDKGRRLALQLGLPQTVVSDTGHSSGPRLIDCYPFADDSAKPVAILLEAGQHFTEDTVNLAYQACVRFLEISGLISSPNEPSPPSRLLEVTDTVDVEHNQFTFARAFKGLECIERRGTIVAVDGSRPVRTPYDDCVLIMPNPAAKPGQTGVRLAREVKQP